MKRISILTSIVGLLLLAACGSGKQAPIPSQAETATLLTYLEENGDILNGPNLPSLINATDVYNQLHGTNMHIIDLRTKEAFEGGHIQHSVNIQPSEILNYFENKINPSAFDFIVLVCPDAMLSGHVNAILLFLGYENVHALRYGLSSWDMDVAADYWLGAMSSHLEGQLEIVRHPKNNDGPLPALATGETDGYRILRKRAMEVLATDPALFTIDIKTLEDRLEEVYLVNYWPEGLYNQGHLPGAIQYTPKISLHSGQDIQTLPTDKPIVLYCFTGHHSSYVTAFLRLLGYDALHMPYGANSFIHHTMLTTQVESRTFTETHVHNYPLTGKTDQLAPAQADRPEEPLPVIGGC